MKEKIVAVQTTLHASDLEIEDQKRIKIYFDGVDVSDKVTALSFQTTATINEFLK